MRTMQIAHFILWLAGTERNEFVLCVAEVCLMKNRKDFRVVAIYQIYVAPRLTFIGIDAFCEYVTNFLSIIYDHCLSQIASFV